MWTDFPIASVGFGTKALFYEDSLTILAALNADN